MAEYRVCETCRKIVLCAPMVCRKTSSFSESRNRGILVAARSAAAYKAAATTITTTSASDPPIASAWPPLAHLASQPTLPVGHSSSRIHSLRSLSTTLANDVASAEVHINQQSGLRVSYDADFGRENRDWQLFRCSTCKRILYAKSFPSHVESCIKPKEDRSSELPSSFTSSAEMPAKEKKGAPTNQLKPKPLSFASKEGKGAVKGTKRQKSTNTLSAAEKKGGWSASNLDNWPPEPKRSKSSDAMLLKHPATSHGSFGGSNKGDVDNSIRGFPTTFAPSKTDKRKKSLKSTNSFNLVSSNGGNKSESPSQPFSLEKNRSKSPQIDFFSQRSPSLKEASEANGLKAPTISRNPGTSKGSSPRISSCKYDSSKVEFDESSYTLRLIKIKSSFPSSALRPLETRVTYPRAHKKFQALVTGIMKQDEKSMQHVPSAATNNNVGSIQARESVPISPPAFGMPRRS